MRTKLVILCLIATMIAYGETFKLGDGITATVTPTHYKLNLSQKSRNGGTAQGSFSGPMKNGKRNGTWTANITFNNFIPEDANSAKTGTITMVRNYREGVLHGTYTYNQKLNFRNIFYTSSGWKYSSEITNDNMSVKGEFDNGFLDGDWVCQGDEVILPTYTIKYRKGVPEYEKIKDYGRVYETTYTDGIVTRYVTTNSNGTIEGWELSSNADIELIKDGEIKKEFGLTKDDDNPLYGFQYEEKFSEYLVPRRMAEWLLYMPTASSNETASEIQYALGNKDEFEVNYFGSEDYVKQMKEEIIKKKEKERRNSLEKINNGYIKDLELARDSIKNSFKLTEEEEVFFRNKHVNLNAPKLKEAWLGYLSKRQDIGEFADTHKSDDYLKPNLELVIKNITDDLDYNQHEYRAAIDMLSAAEAEALNWGAENKEQIRKKALLCYPGLPAEDIKYTITSDRRDGDGKGSFEIETNTIQNLKSSYMSIYNAGDINNKIEWYTWLMGLYSGTPISNLSEITDEDFFLWAVADNMKFDNYGHYEFINKKVKKPERVLQSVNAIRTKIPRFINLDNITVDRIAYGSVTQSGVGTYSKKMKRTVNAGEIYRKATQSEAWLKLKESFAKAVEKASKKK